MITIDLDAKRKEREPHLSGYAHCTACGHGRDKEWVAVAPVGTVELECPACGSMRGQYRYPFGPADGQEVFRCTCEGELFFFLRKADGVGIMCVGCGERMSVDSVFPK